MPMPGSPRTTTAPLLDARAPSSNASIAVRSSSRPRSMGVSRAAAPIKRAPSDAAAFEAEDVRIVRIQTSIVLPVPARPKSRVGRFGDFAGATRQL